jgi:uncharacterized membrane protein
MRGFFKATMIGGLLYLIPLAIVAVLAGKAIALIGSFTDPIAEAISLHELLGKHAARLLAIVALVLLCFIAGLFARTPIARRMMGWLEATVLSMLPGYGFVASLTGDASLTHDADAQKPQAVLARIEDAWQFALKVEQLGDTHVVVFVPGAPKSTEGSVYIMTVDRIRPLQVSFTELSKCLKGLGVGTAALFRARAHPELYS